MALATLALLSAISSAESRPWSKDPTSLAQNYLMINDNRSDNEVVLVYWLASALVPKTAETKAAVELLDKYVVLGVVRGRIANDGTIAFDEQAAVDVSDGAGQALNALREDTMPPSVAAALAAVKGVFTRALGAMGKGVHWFAFDAGAVQCCAKGGMTVTFAGEKYTYDTPIPGCQ
jgi:hypothetical protein